jgi:3-dehydroquinate dehydratase-2
LELRTVVKLLQSNHEGVLIDALHRERAWADGVVLNPGALAHTSYALRDAIAAIRTPTYEVHLSDLRKREAWRRASVLKEVCVGQVMGQGVDSYLKALEALAAGEKPKRTVGRPARSAAPAGDGPRSKAQEPALSRELVRRKISERLAGRMTSAGLSSWARGQWRKVRGGAPAESGQRELLEEALGALAQTGAGVRLTDDRLIELMNQLEA